MALCSASWRDCFRTFMGASVMLRMTVMCG